MKNCLFVRLSVCSTLSAAGSHRNTTHTDTQEKKMKGTLQQQQQQQRREHKERCCYIYHPFIPFYISRPHISAAIVSHPLQPTRKKTTCSNCRLPVCAHSPPLEILPTPVTCPPKRCEATTAGWAGEGSRCDSRFAQGIPPGRIRLIGGQPSRDATLGGPAQPKSASFRQG